MKPKLLFLAHLLPWPLDGGGQIKSYHVLQALAQDYRVQMIALVRRPDETQSVAVLAPLCAAGIQTFVLPRGKARDLALAGTALIAGKSFLMSRDIVPELGRAVVQALSAGDIAALHVDHLQMMAFVPDDTRGAWVVLDEHNVEYRISQRLAGTPGGVRDALVRLYAAREWRCVRAFEQRAVRRADLTLAVSDDDAGALQSLAPERADAIETLPIGVDLEYFAPIARDASSKTLLSIGTMYWPPNVDAALYFYETIFPIIRRREPSARLCLVGARPVASIQALATDSAVTVTGSVPDVRPYGVDCGVFIVPLRSGSGMRVKILNALAMGLPVVSTRVGAEGIEVTDGEELLLADTSEAFAEAVLRVLGDPVLAARLGAHGRQRMEAEYGWAAIGERLRGLYARSSKVGEGGSDR
jgi:sugar transferase (PEP-CTERM/EpsH1 system associated)